MEKDLDISFIIVTNGNRDELLHTVIQGIKSQDIPNYEIIIVGYSKINQANYSNVNYIEERELAEKGLLGAMRTVACERANYDNLVISDDDMIVSSNWYKTLKQSGDFDILTSQVRNPDGTRFWDHTCFRSPKYGHVVLEKDEYDEKYMYMSGGQSWIMKKYVFEKCKWNESFSTGNRANMRNLNDYHEGKGNEDTDFSQKCIKEGFIVSHNHDLLSYHNDPTYSCVGKIVKRRLADRSYDWINGFDKYLPPSTYVAFAASLYNSGYHAESADVIRYCSTFLKNNHLITESYNSILGKNGKELSDDKWTSKGFEPLLVDLQKYNSMKAHSFDDR